MVFEFHCSDETVCIVVSNPPILLHSLDVSDAALRACGSALF